MQKKYTPIFCVFCRVSISHSLTDTLMDDSLCENPSTTILWRSFWVNVDGRTILKWRGYCIERMLQGYGESFHNDGSVYIGEWSQGKMHGTGKYIYPNGDIYNGEWAYGKETGRGSITFRNSGDMFEGQFIDGKKEGNGEYRSAASGRRMKGRWFQDIFTEGYIEEIDFKELPLT